MNKKVILSKVLKVPNDVLGDGKYADNKEAIKEFQKDMIIKRLFKAS